ncbi:RAD50-interacting protein 1 [Microplitis mediator]|uniref:RAD50-interacting protein 1 n=1 Tax=Microplitis mediator TaxID=375433 RepID=UPI002553DB3C|nr:RAD50-interacting protein 1 [Microplitis mediator]
MDIKQQVIDRFNELLGTDLKNLDKMVQFHEQLQLEKRQIEESLTMASTEAPSKIKAAVANVELIKTDIEDSIEMAQNLQESITDSLQRDVKTKSIETIINSLEELERGLSYLSLVKSIDSISNDIESAMASGNDKSMINLFTNLLEISCQLETSDCHNLVNFVRETLHFWHNHLKDKFTTEYMDVLKSLKWPFCGDNISTLASPSSDAMTKFKTLTEYLLQLQLPQETDKSSVKSNLADFLPVSLPINLLVRPLRQRFVYHFTGNKQTNRRDKPEWYFTQILSWIRDHESWIEKNVQPVFNSSDFSYINAKAEFMRALVQLAVEKLHSELPIVQYDDALFAHLVDEALAFERELRENLLYPANQPATVSVLTQAQIFVKWINMEKKYATEKMDAILSAPAAWERIAVANVDNMKVTECAEAFLTLLTAMNERYSHLPQPGHRLQFLELQLELIDDWRVRLLQLLHQDCEDPLYSLIPRVLNSVNYVVNVLMEWGVTVHFLQLHYFKKQCEAADLATDLGLDFLEESAEESGTVFDDAVALLKRLEKELLEEISDSVALEVKARSRPYRTDKWFTMQSDKELASLSVTPSGCLMFEELAARLHLMNQVLSLQLFNQAWRNVASQLDQYLFEGVVLENQFNAGGAVQLKHDITRNLFPLFGLYTNKPESFFPLLRESCLLLNMLLGSVMLLMEVLEGDNEEAAKEVLADVGVFTLSPSSALMVLKARTDVAMQ